MIIYERTVLFSSNRKRKKNDIRRNKRSENAWIDMLYLPEENSSSSGFRSFPQYRHRPPNVVHVLEGNYSSTLEVWTVELIVGEKKSLTINDDSNALVVLINLSQAIIKGEKSYKKL